MKWTCIALALLAASLTSAVATAAPYDIVAVYSDGKEVSINDLQAKPNENVVIPNAFTDGDKRFSLLSIEERLDVKGIDKPYLLPYWRFSVYESTNGAPINDGAGDVLDATTSTKTWTLTKLLAGADKTKFVNTITIKTKGSFTAEMLCGMETRLREEKGQDGKDGKDDTAKKARAKIDADKIDSRQGGRPIRELKAGNIVVLYSFCDAMMYPPGVDSIDWERAYRAEVVADAAGTPVHPFRMGGASTPDELREAHHKALVQLLFPKDLNTQGLELSEVAAPGAGTNVVVNDSQSFSILAMSDLIIRERSNGPTKEGETIGKVIDKNSTLEADFSGLGDECTFATDAPYSLALVTTDPNNNPVIIKGAAITGTPCRPELTVKWSDYLGKELRVELLYQLPGLGGRVLISQSAPFTVRELGLITTFPVVSELLSVASSSNPKSLTTTSSIPVSWTMRVSNGYNAGFTAVTFPWKLSYATRDDPDLGKNFAIYPHVSVVIPAIGQNPFCVVGGGVSLAQFFNFAYGLAPTDGSSYLLVGLGIQDIVKAFH